MVRRTCSRNSVLLGALFIISIFLLLSSLGSNLTAVKVLGQRYSSNLLSVDKNTTSKAVRIEAKINQQSASKWGKDGGIPKIIHQIWNNDVIPEVFHENIKGLVAHNRPPEWTYFFWTLDSGQQFIKKEFPNLLSRFLSAKNLLKADILRLAVMYHYGGAYFDLDTVSVKPLAPYMETHNCSLLTDPPEHALKTDRPKPQLMITNSAILCKPSNWFISHAIKQLETQSWTCHDAISCTGPMFITKLYEALNSTNRSSILPIIEDYELFEDMVTPEKSFHKFLNRACVQEFNKLQYDWAREICRNWIKRGKSERKISEKAFTYHTWFHTYWYPKKLQAGIQKKITELVDNLTMYTGN